MGSTLGIRFVLGLRDLLGFKQGQDVLSSRAVKKSSSWVIKPSNNIFIRFLTYLVEKWSSGWSV